MSDLQVLFEDNHIIAINKQAGDLAQGDDTGDISLDKKVKAYIKEKYDKPGEVFLGVVHRLDRPVSGVILYARTSKALSRLNRMFSTKEVQKKYWAIVKNAPEKESDELRGYMVRNRKQNKSYVHEKPVPESKEALLEYKLLAKSDRYYLLEVHLHTGRHHQIRAQLANIGCPIKGDLKYGFNRSNPNSGISLHARSISFVHPVKKEPVTIVAPIPENDKLFMNFEKNV